MAIVANIKKTNRFRCKTKSYQKTRKWLKRKAHRNYRREAKIAVKTGREIDEKPRLTTWDLY